MIVEYAVIKERYADNIQITGGFIFNVQAEFDKIRSIRQRHLNALEYIASKYGKNKACGNFIIGFVVLKKNLTVNWIMYMDNITSVTMTAPCKYEFQDY